MSDQPAFHCGADECCEGARYPDCQDIPMANIAESALGDLPASQLRESRFVYDPNQEYTHHHFED